MKLLFLSGAFCLSLFLGCHAMGQASSTGDSSGGMDDLAMLSHGRSRSITAENFTGEKGKGGMAVEGTNSRDARDLGQGWKISPGIEIQPGATFTLGSIEGSGIVKHIWMTLGGQWRFAILRVYWDGESEPWIEVPVGDFFASAFEQYAQVSSLAICDNPRAGLNSYWSMPFRKGAKVTVENLDTNVLKMAYEIDYEETPVAPQAAYFHAQFIRSNPVPYKADHTILDDVKGRGQYVGTYLAWGVHNNGWWGEGEMKFSWMVIRGFRPLSVPGRRTTSGVRTTLM